MLIKEYRICMPLTVDEYRIGQLYMIAKHSHDETARGEGVEVVYNEQRRHPVYGLGQYTEKKIHLSSKLPGWVRAAIPKIFYVTEKAWNFYPLTLTEYSCSFVPRLLIEIQTRYEDNNGSSDNALSLSPEELQQREVDHVDIAYDVYPEKHYVRDEDCRYFKSTKTDRGPLQPDWKSHTQPIMCSYKVVKVHFGVWGLQTKVESYIHRGIRDILLVGHRQAFAWIDSWHGMTMDDVRKLEQQFQDKTNKKIHGLDSDSSTSGTTVRASGKC